MLRIGGVLSDALNIVIFKVYFHGPRTILLLKMYKEVLKTTIVGSLRILLEEFGAFLFV